MLGGLVWALVPAVLRAFLGVNEILSTLLMNYLAGGLLLWSLRSWLATPEPVATPRSERLPDAALLPNLLEGTRLHAGALLVVVAVGVLAWWVRSAHGLLVDVHGARPELASRLGIVEWRLVLSTMLLAGVGAGLAGWLQVAGVLGTLYPSVAGGLGFTGVLVALLGDLRAVPVVAAAVVYAALVTGAEGIQQGTGVPSSIASVLHGLLLLAAALAFAERQRRVRRAPVGDEAEPAGTPVRAEAAT
jgi:general nucleoside transport system permease protein